MLKLKSPEELRRIHEHWRSFYRQRNANMEIWRNLYFLTDQSVFVDADGSFVPAEQDEQRVIMPTPWTLIETFRSLLITRPPILSVPPSSVLEVSEEQADAIEKMLWSLWYALDIYGAVASSLWHGLVDGWGVLGTFYVEGAHPPLEVRVFDPYYVFPAPGEGRMDWAYILIEEIQPASVLRARYMGDRRRRATRIAEQALEGFEDSDLVSVLHYWDEERTATIAYVPPAPGPRVRKPREPEARWLQEPREHGYGFLPFVVYLAQELPFRDKGERMSLGVLFPIEDAIRRYNQLLSQVLTALRKYADPIKVSATEGGQAIEWPEGTGGEIALAAGEQVYYLTYAQSLPALSEFIKTLEGSIHDATLPTAMMGRYEGALSGIALSLLRNPTLMRIAFKQSALQRALERVNENLLRIVEGFLPQPYYIWGESPTGEPVEGLLDPDVIRGYYRNHVHLSASLPADIPALTTVISALVQMGLVSRRSGRDVAQRVLAEVMPQSVEDEEQRILLETLLEDPLVRQALAMRLLKEEGMDPDLAEALAMQGGPQQALPPMPGPGGARPMGEPIPQMPGQVVPPGTAPFAPENTRPSARQIIERVMAERRRQQGGRPKGV